MGKRKDRREFIKRWKRENPEEEIEKVLDSTFRKFSIKEEKRKKREFTRDYFSALGDIYAEKGPLAAIGYDISSTFQYLYTLLRNIPDRDVVHGNIELADGRSKETKEYMLRGKKQESGEGLGGRVSIFSILVIGGIALTVTSLSSTGYVVSNSIQNAYGWSGIFLFIFGVVGLAFLRKK